MSGIIVALTLGIVMISINASSQDFIVASDGSGNFKTIGEALKAVGPEGGDILIKSGEYAETLRIEGRKAINIRTEGEVRIKAKGTENSITIIDCYNIDIRGLKFSSGISIAKCDDCIISACVFNGSSSNGITIIDSRNVHILGNQFKRCAPEGIVVRNSTKTIIVNNLFTDNITGHGIYLKEHHDYGSIEIKNNTIANNQFTPLLIEEKWEKVKIWDNIIAFNTLPEKTAAIHNKSTPYEIQLHRNLLFRNNAKSGVQTDYAGVKTQDDIAIDPLFENSSSGNFNLKTFSPAVGAGTNGITIGYYQTIESGIIKFKEEFENAIAKYKHREYEEAVTWFKKILASHPGNTDVWVGLGDSYIPLKLYKDATSAYQKSLKLTADKPEAYFGLASIYSLQHNTAEALTYLSKALQNGMFTIPVETDSNLNPIRNTEGYKKLKQQYGLEN